MCLRKEFQVGDKVQVRTRQPHVKRYNGFNGVVVALRDDRWPVVVRVDGDWKNMFFEPRELRKVK